MVHFFDADIAKKYGVNAAVLACFLWDCIEQKSTESPQLHEGKVWVRCSVQMMTGFFPFLSYDEIRYALKRLRKFSPPRHTSPPVTPCTTRKRKITAICGLYRNFPKGS